MESRDLARARRDAITAGDRREEGRLHEAFARFARAAAEASGTMWAFLLAVAYVAAWAVGGVALGFTDGWQLWLNTVATFITFLMVFLIQTAQNRHTQVLQIKLDELLASHENASNLLIDLEDLTEEEIERLRERYQRLADECARRYHRGAVSIDTPWPAPSRRRSEGRAQE